MRYTLAAAMKDDGIKSCDQIKDAARYIVVDNSCCGMAEITHFAYLLSLPLGIFQELMNLTSSAGHRSFVAGTLNMEQMNWRSGIRQEEAKKRGFKQVADFINRNTGNRVYLFVREL